MTRTLQVAVCGPADCTESQAAHAELIGRRLAAAGAVVVCGGGPGVMAAVARGAHEAGGIVVGIGPGADRRDASEDLTVSLATNLGQARNAVIVWSADAVVAVGGSWGTLSEIALARRRGVPVVVLDGWQVRDAAGAPLEGFLDAATADEAAALALRAAADHAATQPGSAGPANGLSEG
jgi:uncharacterized protein (TIGR00725 family)